MIAPPKASAAAQAGAAQVAELGFKPVANAPDEFSARIKLEIDRWGKLVRDANLKIE